MKHKIVWRKPIALRLASDDELLIYSVDVEKVPDVAGIYIFARHWGNSYEALYVGKSTNLRLRLRQHLNNVSLMKHIKKAKTGKRFLIVGATVTKSDKKIKKVLNTLERAFIRKFLAEGHDLINKHGTRIRRHEILSEGPVNKSFIPTTMFLEKGKGE